MRTENDTNRGRKSKLDMQVLDETWHTGTPQRQPYCVIYTPSIFERPFAKWFALCYPIVYRQSCYSPNEYEETSRKRISNAYAIHSGCNAAAPPGLTATRELKFTKGKKRLYACGYGARVDSRLRRSSSPTAPRLLAKRPRPSWDRQTDRHDDRQYMHRPIAAVAVCSISLSTRALDLTSPQWR